MPDIAALVTPPLLLDSTGAPANGDIYTRVTSSIEVSGGFVTPTQGHGIISFGQFKALDGTAFNLPVTPEGVAVQIFVELREERPEGRKKHSIRRTVSVPNQSTVTWLELVDVVPVDAGNDYEVPTWVTNLLVEAVAAGDVAIGARDEAVNAQTAAELAKADAEAAAASVPSAGDITSEITAATAPKLDAATAATTYETKTHATSTFAPADLAVTFIHHGSDPNVSRGVAPGRRIWIGDAVPVNFQLSVDLLVKPVVPVLPAVPTSGLLARYHASTIFAASGAAITSWPDTLGTYHLTAVGGPLFKTEGGKSFVETDGVNDALTNTTLTRNQPNTMVVVGRYKTLGTGKTIVSGSNGVSIQTIGITGGGNTRIMFAGAATMTGTTENTDWHVFIATYNGATSELVVDGTAVIATGNPGTANAIGLRIGGNPGMSVFSDVQIAEILPYNRVLTSTEKTDVTTSLKAFYGIA